MSGVSRINQTRMIRDRRGSWHESRSTSRDSRQRAAVPHIHFILNGRCEISENHDRGSRRSWPVPGAAKFSPIGSAGREIYGTGRTGVGGRELFSKLSASCIALSLQFGHSIFTASLGKLRARNRDVYAMHVSRAADTTLPLLKRAPPPLPLLFPVRSAKAWQAKLMLRLSFAIAKRNTYLISGFYYPSIRYNNARQTGSVGVFKLDLANFTTVIIESDIEILDLFI